MKKNALVSVIIPCFNQGLYIDETLNSVYKQTYLDIEIILIDDGSDDFYTKQKINELSSECRITLLKVENNGVSAARNFAIQNAKGKYILPLDADDLISETYIEKAVSVLEKDKTIDLVYCRASYFGERTGEIDLGEYSSKTMLGRNQIFNSALLKREKILQINGYDESFKLGWEDWDFYLRYISDVSQVFKLNEILFFYRIKSNSRNESLQMEKLKEVESQLFNKHLKLYLSYYSNPISLVRQYECNLTLIDDLNSTIRNIKNSTTFKVGSTIILPFRLIYNCFIKWIRLV